MKRCGVQLTEVTYATILEALSKRGEAEETLLLLKSMKEQVQFFWKNEIFKFFQNIKPSVLAYNAAISSFAMRKDMNAVLKLVQEMQRDDVQPNLVTHSVIAGSFFFYFNLTLLDLLGKGKNIEGMMQYFKQLRISGIKPDVAMINILLNALGRAGIGIKTYPMLILKEIPVECLIYLTEWRKRA
jgi:pentatricopeptide repeat protein